MNQFCAQEIRMAETAEVFALRQKVRDLRGQLHSRDKALRLKREEERRVKEAQRLERMAARHGDPLAT